jgi:hypothetical protein
MIVKPSALLQPLPLETKVTLKSLKVANHLSEETVAFTADLYVDGKKAFHVSNRGNGGPNLYVPYGYTPTLFQLETWAMESTGESYEALDMIVGKIADQMEQEKMLKRSFKTQVLMIDGDKMFGWKLQKNNPNSLDAIKNQITTQYPSAIVLNDMSIEKAAELVLALP